MHFYIYINVRKCAVHQLEVVLRSHLQNLAVTPGFVLRELLDRFLGLVESARGSRDDDFVSVAVDLDAGARVGLDLLEGRAAFADDNAVVGLWDDDLFARGLLGFLAQDNPGLVDRRLFASDEDVQVALFVGSWRTTRKKAQQRLAT